MVRSCHKQHSQRAHKTPRSVRYYPQKEMAMGRTHCKNEWQLSPRIDQLETNKTTTPRKTKDEMADSIAKHIGKKWMTSAEHRQDGHNQEETFIQQWRVDGWRWWWVTNRCDHSNNKTTAAFNSREYWVKWINYLVQESSPTADHIFFAIIYLWLDMSISAWCPQVVSWHWGENEPFSALLALDRFAECDQQRKSRVTCCTTAEYSTRATGEETVKYSHSPTDLSWPGSWANRQWDMVIPPLSHYHDSPYGLTVIEHLTTFRLTCHGSVFSHYSAG